MCRHIWLKYRRLWRNTTQTHNHIHAHNFKWNKMLLWNTMSTTATKFEKGLHRRRWRLYVSHAYSTNEAFSNRINVRRGSRHSLSGGRGFHYLPRKFYTQKQKKKTTTTKTRSDREEEVVSAPCTHGPCPASFFAEGKEREETWSLCNC